MENRTIDLPRLYKFSFHQFKKYASFTTGCMATYTVIAIIPQIYFLLRAPLEPTAESRLISFLLTLVQLYLGVGFIKIMLYLIEDAQVRVANLFNNVAIFLSYFVASFLFGAAVLAGLFLLIAPGIYIAIRLQFYPFYIIEQGDNAFSALWKSFDATRGLALELFLFGITVFVINLAGMLCLGIGILFTYPLTTMATAVIYRSLQDEGIPIPAARFSVD